MATTQAQSGVAAEILKRTCGRSEALVHKDVAALQELLAEEFVYTNASGMVLGKQEYLELYAQGQSMVWSAQVVDDAQVRMYGEAAVVVCRVHDIATMLGEPFDGYFRSTLVWVRRDEIWRCVAGQTTATERPASAPVS